jgi:hypothetical protein
MATEDKDNYYTENHEKADAFPAHTALRTSFPERAYSGPSVRDVVLFVSPDGDTTQMDQMAPYIKTALMDDPGVVYEAATEEEGPGMLTDLTHWRVVMCLAGANVSMETLDAMRKEGRAIPILINDDNGELGNKIESPENVVANGLVDGYISPEFGQDNINELLVSVVERRREKFEEIESEARGTVLVDLLFRIDELLHFPINEITVDEGGRSFTGTTAADATEILEWMQKALEEIRTQRVKIVDKPIHHDKEARKTFHDLINSVGIITMNMTFLKSNLMLLTKRGRVMLKELDKLASWTLDLIKKTQAAYRTWPTSWNRVEDELLEQNGNGAKNNSNIKNNGTSKNTYTESVSNLPEMPKEAFYIIIDDIADIAEALSLNIQIAGVPEVHISLFGENLGDLAAKVNGERVVILLDHQLGKAGYGHELLPKISELFPGADVIVHSAMASELELGHGRELYKGVRGFAGKNDLKKIRDILT